MEIAFIVLAFVGTFSAGFFFCLFLGCCIVIAEQHAKDKKRKTKIRSDFYVGNK